MSEESRKLLLHICCAGCGAYVAAVLKKEGYGVTLFFYNPNLWPEKEFLIRAEEAARVAEEFAQEIIIIPFEHASWLEKVKGLEQEPEKGERCLLCYEDRLRQTAGYARDHGFGAFTSTLTVSPHKLAGKINEIGEKLASEYGLEFLNRDFKKQDGFKKSTELSRGLNLYRQTYCGCEFSMRK